MRQENPRADFVLVILDDRFSNKVGPRQVIDFMSQVSKQEADFGLGLTFLGVETARSGFLKEDQKGQRGNLERSLGSGNGNSVLVRVELVK